MKKYSILLILTFTSLAFYSCTNNSESSDNANTMDTEEVDAEATMAAFNQMKTTCYVCHSPEAFSAEAVLAPAFVEVKERYLEKYPDKNAFVNAMVSYVNKPNEEHSLMTEYIEKLKIMPDPTIDSSAIASIVNFIYDNELAYPEWYPAFYKEKYNKEFTEL